MNKAGVPTAIGSAVLLGLAPIFGKQAILAGMDSYAVVAVRTAAATCLLFLVILVVRRNLLNIYPLGLLGCAIAGTFNGVGSLLYYAGLARLDAGLAQLLYALYPVFVALILYLDGYRHPQAVIISLLISIPAVYLLLQSSSNSQIDVVGACLMLASGLLYALHIPINQRVLYEVPAPTVTLYTLIAMTLIVLPAFIIFSPTRTQIPSEAIAPLIGLTAVTFLSRLALFTGVKMIGGMRTSLLGLAELIVTITLAHLCLAESLSFNQWLGVMLLIVSLLLAGYDQTPVRPVRSRSLLSWLRPRSSSTPHSDA
jgi:drug/metabolite transporter (DMT)-like permease